YVTHPSSVANYEDEYQGELQGDSQEDKITTAMLLLARAITQKNQAFNARTENDESNQIVQRVPRTKSTPSKANIQCYNCNEIGHYAHDCQKPRVRDAKYFREQMLLAMKDEAKSNLKDEENDFMLDNSYGGETLEELTVAKNEVLRNALEKSSSDSKDIQANLLKRIKILENDFKRSQAQSIDFELKLQHQKERMACDVSWKSRLSTLNDENVNTDSTSKELDELIEHVNKKTYAYADVRAQNQDLLMTISELKNKLKTIKKGKNVNTKFDKSETSGTLLYVTPLPKNIAVKAKKVSNTKVIQPVLWIVDSGCSKHMTGNLSLLRNFIEKFMGTVRFENDHFAAITGYGYYVQGNLTICHGDDLLTGFRESNLYTISIFELAASSPVYLMSKATSTTSWLWHRRLSHLNFSTMNQLTSKDLVDALPKFKYNKDHLCSACEQGKSKKASLPPKLNRSIVHTRYNKTPYELIRRRKTNVQYFHVFGSLCYLINNRDDLGKMKPMADIGIFIGYSESSRGFHIYNHQTKKIMEMIHVKFDEVTAMASECNNLEPEFNCTNFQDSSEDSQSLPSKIDLDNLFGPLYEEYYSTSSPEVSNNYAANTLDNENTSSSSSIVVEEDEAPQIVSLSAEQVFSKPDTPVLNDNANELVQEDVAELEGNAFYNLPQTHVFEEAESSSTY
ncbi:retrovirus-related pol polyprotein from transposon TNT 1-94, partial [Tanacetum coccineum]